MSSETVKFAAWGVELVLLLRVAYSFLRIWRTQSREMRYVRTGKHLPPATAMEKGIDPNAYKEVLSLPVLGNLLRVLGIKAKKRLIDEAVVITALEEDVFRRGSVFREVA